MADVSSFRSQFLGGTRQNRFIVHGSVGTESTDLNSQTKFFVKAGQLPPSTVGIIPVPYRGRIVKVPGDRQYLEWPIVCYDQAKIAGGRQSGGEGNGGEGAQANVNASTIYRAMHDWSEQINSHVNNVQSEDWTDIASGGLTEWKIAHLDLEGNALKGYKLINCWPVEIGSIDLSFDALDTVVEFPVTLAYDHFVPLTSDELGAMKLEPAGNAGDAGN